MCTGGSWGGCCRTKWAGRSGIVLYLAAADRVLPSTDPNNAAEEISIVPLGENIGYKCGDIPVTPLPPPPGATGSTSAVSPSDDLSLLFCAHRYHETKSATMAISPPNIAPRTIPKCTPLPPPLANTRCDVFSFPVAVAARAPDELVSEPVGADTVISAVTVFTSVVTRVVAVVIRNTFCRSVAVTVTVSVASGNCHTVVVLVVVRPSPASASANLFRLRLLRLFAVVVVVVVVAVVVVVIVVVSSVLVTAAGVTVTVAVSVIVNRVKTVTVAITGVVGSSRLASWRSAPSAVRHSSREYTRRPPSRKPLNRMILQVHTFVPYVR